MDTIKSIEPLTVEFEYELDEPIQGLRLGIYLQTNRGEVVFTSFDTDAPEMYDRFGTRPAGRFVSRGIIPANMLNEGQYILGVNVSVFKVKQYFHDEHVLAFSVDPMGAPGMHWGEMRMGLVRPSLDWQIEEVLD